MCPIWYVGVNLTPTRRPPTPQTCENTIVFIGCDNIRRMPPWPTLGKLCKPATPKNGPQHLQDEPKDLPRTPPRPPKWSQQTSVSQDSKVTGKAYIVRKKSSKVIQEVPKVTSKTAQGQKTSKKKTIAFCICPTCARSLDILKGRRGGCNKAPTIQK